MNWPLVEVGLSFLLSLFGALAVSRWAPKLGLLDIPNDRSSHFAATPKGGGIGIAAGVIFISILAGVPFLLWASVLGISLLGLSSDRFEISPAIRLTVEFLLAAILLSALESGFGDDPGLVTAAILAVFIVGTANFFNFMDGIDGIAALTGIVGFGLLAWHGVRTGADPAVNWLAVGAVAGCAGFLPLNFPHARVFMGDSGSVLLGFLFAAIAVAGARTLADLVCRAAFLLPFYFDEVSTMALRVRDGESLVRPHRRHTYQLMANELSIPHARVALGYAVAQALMGTSVLLAAPLSAILVPVLIGIYAVVFCLLSGFVRRRALAAACR